MYIQVCTNLRNNKEALQNNFLGGLLFYDILLKNGHLKDSARNNSLKDFRFAYFDAVQDALLEGYEQNQDFFALLLENEDKKKELMHVFLEDVYKNLRE